MNIWHDISEGRITPKKFEAFIEIPKGNKVKYELDKETGLLRLDRVLYTSTVRIEHSEHGEVVAAFQKITKKTRITGSNTDQKHF